MEGRGVCQDRRGSEVISRQSLRNGIQLIAVEEVLRKPEAKRGVSPQLDEDVREVGVVQMWVFTTKDRRTRRYRSTDRQELNRGSGGHLLRFPSKEVGYEL